MTDFIMVKEIMARLGWLLNICLFIGSHALAVEVGGIAGGNFNVPVKSFAARKFETIYKQEFDFSCGSAALASMLTFHYDDLITEHEIFIDMFNHGDQEKIREYGFSLLDMKQYLDRRGYSSNGFQIKLDQLNVPAITIINNKGYLHFVVIKAVSGTEVLIGDPSLGVKSIDRKGFERMWENRILFMIYDHAELAAKTFQSKEEWSRRVKAPIGDVVNRESIGRGNLLKRGSHDL